MSELRNIITPPNKMWKKLNSKEVFVHPRLTIIEDEVELPSGHKTTYLRHKHTNNGALIICQRADQKILLISDYGYIQNQHFFMLPGGAIPLDEDIAAGANRELMEETDLSARTFVPLGHFYYEHRRTETVTHVLYTNDFSTEPRPGDLEEDITLHWLTEDEIDAMIGRNEIVHAVTLAAWCLYKNKKNGERSKE